MSGNILELVKVEIRESFHQQSVSLYDSRLKTATNIQNGETRNIHVPTASFDMDCGNQFRKRDLAKPVGQ